MLLASGRIAALDTAGTGATNAVTNADNPVATVLVNNLSKYVPLA